MNRSRLSPQPAHLLRCALLFAPALLGGCSQSQMTQMWKDPSYNDGPMKKVFAIAVRKDPVRRRIWEDAFVEELKTHGVAGVPSYSMFPSEAPDSLQVSDSVGKEGFDGVAISVRLPDSTQDTYVAGYTTTEPVTVYRPFLHGYATYWRRRAGPGVCRDGPIPPLPDHCVDDPGRRPDDLVGDDRDARDRGARARAGRDSQTDRGRVGHRGDPASQHEMSDTTGRHSRASHREPGSVNKRVAGTRPTGHRAFDRACITLIDSLSARVAILVKQQ